MRPVQNPPQKLARSGPGFSVVGEIKPEHRKDKPITFTASVKLSQWEIDLAGGDIQLAVQKELARVGAKVITVDTV
jgi:hypothetical protein